MEKFDYTFRVHAGDSDYMGLMYHANYVDYFERARVEWFIHLGINLAELAEQQIFFPVANLSIDYIRPVYFKEKAVIKSDITRVGKVSLLFDQHMYNGDVLAAKTKVKVGCVGEGFKPAVIPDFVKEKLYA